MGARLARHLGRLRVRLLVVNLVLLLVPVAGLEFARVHERQLLEALERDMRDQTALVRASLEADLARGVPLDDPAHLEVLVQAARETRTRVRLVDASGEVVVDSHADGPPEGPEPPPPSMLPTSTREVGERVRSALRTEAPWPEVRDRREVRAALAGRADATTRVRARRPGVFLFVTEPVREDGRVAGAVYAVRSTQPVLVELYRIRSGLFRVLAVAIALTLLVTLLLAWSITTPIERLSRAAKRVAAGEPGVVLPVGGGGELRELGEAFAAMKERLDARLRYIEGFAADVAHEFKSPLTSIRGAAELLEEGAAEDPDARRRFLRNIELDVARLDRLVSRLLELSRIEASSEPVAPIDVAALAARVAERSGTPDQRVEVVVTARHPVALARETDLETALVNLVDNAVRFSPAGAPVELRVEDAA
ncbi:MAG TPA: histidine kinase dimerization/phospho-acceptor domain-containing protein, partial [Minicystis sp.]|nr:histidine kinase dimerization/phospho-acceptor domain-containing protein [Minicystis sp.]